MRARSGLLLLASSVISPTLIVLVAKPVTEVGSVQTASPKHVRPQEPPPDPPPPGICRLTGRIVDERGEIVEHAQVELLTERQPAYFGPRLVESDAFGRFRFESDAAHVGWYAIKASLSEFHTVVRQLAASRGTHRARVPAPALDDRGDLTLLPAGVVEGRVLSQRGPIVRANIDMARTENQVRTIQTGNDGRFRLGSLEPGTWAVFPRAIGRGYLPGRRTLVTVTAQRVTELPDIVIEDGFAIEGLLTDWENQPVPGSLAVLAWSSTGESARATVSPRGSFLLRLPSDDLYTLGVERTPAGFKPWGTARGSTGNPFRPGAFVHIWLEREP